MKKWEADRLAYHYAEYLLPFYIKNLKDDLMKTKFNSNRDQFSRMIKVAERDLEEIIKMHCKILNKGDRK